MLKGTGLKPETRKLMLTPQVPVREGGSQTIGRPDAKPRTDVFWGLGWGLQTTTDGLSFWHWGDNGDYKAYVLAFDQPKTAVVVLANSRRRPVHRPGDCRRRGGRGATGIRLARL